jgi:hypothetical protein
LERTAAEWADAVLSLKNLRRESHDSAAVGRVENSRFNLDHCVSTMKARYTQLATPHAGSEPLAGQDAVNGRATA